MAELKTKPSKRSVTEFMRAIPGAQYRKDCAVVAGLMRQATGRNAKLWGENIVGFDQYHYKYASGHEGDSFRTGFSPRKANLTIYIMPGFSQFSALMKRLGKHRTGKSCLYIKRLADIDVNVLQQIIERSVRYMKKTYG